MRKSLKNLVALGRFDRVLSKVEILSVENGKMTAEMTVTDEHANVSGTMHGGMTATIIDQVSSMALASAYIKNIDDWKDKPIAKIASASVELSVSYFNPAKIGDVIIIESETLKAGRQLAFLEVTISSKETRKIIAKGKHTKFVTNINP